MPFKHCGKLVSGPDTFKQMQGQNQIPEFDPPQTVTPVNVLAGNFYDSSGNYTQSIILHRDHEMIFGPNDFTAKVGFGGTAQNFVPPPTLFFFNTSNSNALTLTGVPNAPVTMILYQLN